METKSEKNESKLYSKVKNCSATVGGNNGLWFYRGCSNTFCSFIMMWCAALECFAGFDCIYGKHNSDSNIGIGRIESGPKRRQQSRTAAREKVCGGIKNVGKIEFPLFNISGAIVVSNKQTELAIFFSCAFASANLNKYRSKFAATAPEHRMRARRTEWWWGNERNAEKRVQSRFGRFLD